MCPDFGPLGLGLTVGPKMPELPELLLLALSHHTSLPCPPVYGSNMIMFSVYCDTEEDGKHSL